MTRRLALWIPAALLAAASLVLILYAWLGVSHPAPPEHAAGGPPAGMHPKGEKGGEELFKTFGTLAVFASAVSYCWVRLKKKRRSASPLVRWLVTWFDRLHPIAGYTAIVLVGAHGVYFLTQAAIKDDTHTGIAAFALLLGLGVYGLLIRRLPRQNLRKVHFALASAFAFAALLHAGGSAIMAVLSTAALWGVVRLLERTARPSGQRAG